MRAPRSGQASSAGAPTNHRRTSQDWIIELQSQHPEEPLADLRALLLRGLRAALAQRLPAESEEILEDFVQEAMIKVLENLPNFRGESQFTTWAQKIAINVAFSELRRRRWQDVSLQSIIESQEGEDFTPSFLADPNATPEEQTARTEMFSLVEQIIHTELTGRQREALLALVVAGMPLGEVAHKLNTNPNALYKLVFDARQRLVRGLANAGLSSQDVLSVFG